MILIIKSLLHTLLAPASSTLSFLGKVLLIIIILVTVYYTLKPFAPFALFMVVSLSRF